MAQLPPPNASIPLHMDTGYVNTAWYRWFNGLGVAIANQTIDLYFPTGPTGPLGASAVVWSIKCQAAYSFSAGLPGAYVDAGTPATTPSTLTLVNSGVVVATAFFDAGSSVGVIATPTGAFNTVAGGTLAWIAAATPDATLGLLNGGLQGVKT